MLRFSFTTLTTGLIISWLSIGIVTLLCSFGGCIYQPLSILLLVPLSFLILIGCKLLLSWKLMATSEQWLGAIVGGILVLHATGLLVPETGFDAVWYHLPVVQTITQTHRLVYLPDLYQSLNPLFSDLLFLLGFQLNGSPGTKVVAYLLGLSLLCVSYQLSRVFLSRKWSLLTVICVTTFQVFSWQMTSFYVDVAKALWEVAAIWILIRSHRSEKKGNHSNSWWLLSLSALCLSASLATKLFSLLLVPVVGVAVAYLMSHHRWQKTCVYVCLSLVLALPFWLRSYVLTGKLFLSANLHLNQIQTIGNSPNLVSYLVSRTLSLPTSPFYLVLWASDYVTLAIVVLGVLVLLNWKIWLIHKELGVLLLFGLGQWLVWWYIPPVSTRYALSGFIVLTLCCLKSAADWIHQRPEYRWPLYGVIFLSCVINLVPRLVVAERSLEYVLYQQNTPTYLQQFYDGSIDSHLKKWYHLEK